MISKNFIPNKKSGEEIIIHLWRHWFIFFKIFLLVLILLALPMMIYWLFQVSWPQLLTGEIFLPFFLTFIFIYYLIVIVLAFTFWTENYLDVWTVTTDRIINREQNGLFNRVVSELSMEVIQDVTVEQKGFFATLLHYGNVHIQTAGTVERFVFEEIPHPFKVAKIIQKLNEKAKKNSNQSV